MLGLALIHVGKRVFNKPSIVEKSYLHTIVPYLRVYHVENYVIHHHVVLHGGSRSKICWHHLLFIP